MSIRETIPDALNAMELLSGDQVGKVAPSVPGSDCAAIESRGRNHKEGVPAGTPALNTRYRQEQSGSDGSVPL